MPPLKPNTKRMTRREAIRIPQREVPMLSSRRHKNTRIDDSENQNECARVLQNGQQASRTPLSQDARPSLVKASRSASQDSKLIGQTRFPASAAACYPTKSAPGRCIALSSPTSTIDADARDADQVPPPRSPPTEPTRITVQIQHPTFSRTGSSSQPSSTNTRRRTGTSSGTGRR